MCKSECITKTILYPKSSRPSSYSLSKSVLLLLHPLPNSLPPLSQPCRLFARALIVHSFHFYVVWSVSMSSSNIYVCVCVCCFSVFFRWHFQQFSIELKLMDCAIQTLKLNRNISPHIIYIILHYLHNVGKCMSVWIFDFCCCYLYNKWYYIIK